MRFAALSSLGHNLTIYEAALRYLEINLVFSNYENEPHCRRIYRNAVAGYFESDILTVVRMLRWSK